MKVGKCCVGCLVKFVFIALKCDANETFFHDTGLARYLNRICQDTNQFSVIVFDHLLAGNESKPNPATILHRSPLHRYLAERNCYHAHNSYFSAEKIGSLFFSANYFHSNRCQIIFDFSVTPEQSASEARFAYYLDILSHLYFNCSDCAPFIVLYDLTVDVLLAYLRDVHQQVRSDFYARLVSLWHRARYGSVVYLNPVIDGCVRYRGPYRALNSSDYARLKVPYTKCDLHGAFFTISVNTHDKEGRAFNYGYSIEMEMLKMMQLKYNFTYSLINNHQDWGNLINGTWTGLVGYVHNRTAEFGMCKVKSKLGRADQIHIQFTPYKVSQTLQRFRDFEFSRLIYADDLTFMTRSSGRTNKVEVIVSPFDKHVWRLIGASYVVILTALYAIYRALHCEHSLNATALELYSIYMRQSHHFRQQSTSSRLLLAFWMLSAVIMYHVFNSIFYSILTVPKFRPLIDTIDDLKQAALSDSHNIVLVKGNSFLHRFLYADKAQNELYYILGAHFNRTSMPHMLTHINEAIPTVERDPSTIVVHTRTTLAIERYMKAQKLIHIAAENVGPDFVSMVFPKRSPLVKPFNKIIEHIKEQGIFHRWMRISFEHLKSNNSNARQFKSNGRSTLYENPDTAEPNEEDHSKGSFRTFSVQDLISLVYIWGVGVGLSSSAFILELAFFFVGRRNLTFKELLDRTKRFW